MTHGVAVLPQAGADNFVLHSFRTKPDSVRQCDRKCARGTTARAVCELTRRQLYAAEDLLPPLSVRIHVQAALDAATEANQKSVAAELIQELSAWVPHAKRHKSDPKPQTSPRSATAPAAGTVAAAAAAAHSRLLMGKSSADAHALPAAAPSNGPLQQLLPQDHQQQPQPQMQLPGPMDAAQQAPGFIAGCAQDVRGVYTCCAPLPSPSVGQAGAAGVESTMVQPCWDSLAAQIAADLAETEELPSGFVLNGPGSAGSSSSCDGIGHRARRASVASGEQQEGDVCELLGCEVEGTRGPAGVGVQNCGGTQQPHQQQQLLGTFAAMDCTPCAPPGVQGQGAAAGIGVSVAPQASPALPQGAPGAAAAAAAFGGLQQQRQEVVPLAPAMPQAQGLSGFLPYGQQQSLLRNTTHISRQPGAQQWQHTLHQSSLSTLNTLVPKLQAVSQQHQLLGQQLAVMHEELAAALAALHMFQAG